MRVLHLIKEEQERQIKIMQDKRAEVLKQWNAGALSKSEAQKIAAAYTKKIEMIASL